MNFSFRSDVNALLIVEYHSIEDFFSFAYVCDCRVYVRDILSSLLRNVDETDFIQLSVFYIRLENKDIHFLFFCLFLLVYERLKKNPTNYHSSLSAISWNKVTSMSFNLDLIEKSNIAFFFQGR